MELSFPHETEEKAWLAEGIKKGLEVERLIAGMNACESEAKVPIELVDSEVEITQAKRLARARTERDLSAG